MSSAPNELPMELPEAVRQRLQCLLLQVRNADDPMRDQEVGCFARALRIGPQQIAVCDVLAGVPGRNEMDRADLVLLGGSGHYSAAGGGAWLERLLDCLAGLHEHGKPTFASCWGFQALARALGGQVRHTPQCAEVGTITLQLTEAGRADPVFSILPDEFQGLAGHEDSVVCLPPGAVRLASSAKVENQAYTFPGKPIYCTQFHPELNRQGMLQRLQTYPEYVRRVAGLTVEEFARNLVDTPRVEALLRRFTAVVFG